MFIFVFFIIVAFLILIYSLYVSLIKKRNRVLEAFSGIDVQLKKRYDLIPNILTIASKFMQHEKSLLEEITKLRSQAVQLDRNHFDYSKKIELDNNISDKMNKIIMAFENYPDLKSDKTMIQAMQTYNEIEEHIAAARCFYNSAAQELKNAVEIFPSSIVASVMGIESQEFFRVSDSEKGAINAADYLK